MGHIYTLIFINKTSQKTTACLFQKLKSVNFGKSMNVAWQTKMTHSNTRAQFKWSCMYDFVWGEPGKIKPHIIFAPSQILSANLDTENSITFTYQSGAYLFKNLGSTNPPNQFVINESNQLPNDQQAAVGIGMAKKPTNIIQALPNVNLCIRPNIPPRYFITAGNYTQGEVLPNKFSITPHRVKFPSNVYSMTAILKPDFTFKIMTTQEANENGIFS